MKKIAFGFVAALLAAGGWQHRETKKLYLKNETWAKHVDRQAFFSKLDRPLPCWMEERIGQDFYSFSAISKIQVDATFAQILSRINSGSFVVRYRIVDNELYRYFLSGESISLEDNSTEKALKTLLEYVRFENLDFLLSYFDGVPVMGFAEDVYTTASPIFQAPLLSSATLKNAPSIVLIPDWRSIGHWWISDIKHIKSRKDKFPWEKKKEFAVWRGSLTKPERLLLCQISSLYPERLDAKLNLLVDDPVVQKQIEENGWFGGRVSWEEFLECKYLPLADGVMCAAPAMQWRLLSNCLVFKPESDEIQWFYDALQPYVHYVPVKRDFSDLIERFDWARQNDGLCKEIADRAAKFASDHLMYEDVLLYLSAVLKRYALLQTGKNELKKEINEDPRWVKIRDRKKLKKEAEKRQMNGFTLNGTPF